MLDTSSPEKVERVLKAYSDHVNPTLAKLLKLSGYALVEERAEGIYIWASGRKYMDLLGSYGAIVLGHRHPEVVKAVKNALDTMPLSSKVFLSEPLGQLSEALAELTGLDYVFLCNSGAEAVEAAIKMVRASTGRKVIISTLNSFHGKTMGALSVTGRDIYKKGLPPMDQYVRFVPYGDVDAIANAIDDDVAGVILEPIQGEGGIIVPPDDYLPKVREITAERGVALILDEIQTGMGRTGYFFAFQRYGIKPDMVTLAKGLGGGVVPIGALVSSKEYWKPLIEHPTYHTSTFGGNPLATSAALATIKVLRDSSLIKEAERKGEKLLSSLNSLKNAYPEIIADVRGRGLMIGLEVTDESLAGGIFYELVKRGILTAYTLNQPKVIRIEPPLIITDEQIEEAMSKFDEALSEVKRMFAL